MTTPLSIDNEEKHRLWHGLRVFRASFLFRIAERLTFYERSLCAAESMSLDEESYGVYASCRLNFNLLVKQVRDVLCVYTAPLNLARQRGENHDSLFWRCVCGVVERIHVDQKKDIDKIWVTVAQMDDNMRFLGFQQSRAPVSSFPVDCSKPFDEASITEEVLNVSNATHEVTQLSNFHVRAVGKTPPL